MSSARRRSSKTCPSWRRWERSSMADQPLVDGNVTFVQHFLPALESGEYTLSVAHTVTSTDPKQPFTETYKASADFLIGGTRWSLDPAEVDSVFPPPETKGEFVNV